MSIVQGHEVRVLCILIVIQVSVSFRAVPRFLGLMKEQGLSQIAWVPHFTSVINWILRYGLFKLNNVQELQKPWAAVIDHSIDIGVKKILVVLRVTLDHFANSTGAPTLKDCECIGLCIAEKNDYKTVAQQLEDIFSLSGNPTLVIKDGAGNLAKGVNLWKEKAKPKLCVIVDDIGHTVANALKSQFSKLKQFKKLLAIIRSGAAQLRQTNLAHLTPPKIRTKGRFQSISKVISWCENMLKGLATLSDQDIKKQFNGAFTGLSSLKTFISQFSTTTNITNEVQALLKNQGLNHDTFCKAIQLVHQLPVKSNVRKKLSKWLKSHYGKWARLGNRDIPLLVSSDILESLFGKYKTIISRSSIEDMNRMALIIPTLCGQKPNESELQQVFSETKHDDIKQWTDKNISHTLRSNRLSFKKEVGWIDKCQKTGKKAA